MNIAFLVKSVEALLPTYTTVLLAHEAHRRGHAVWLVRSRDLVIDVHGRIFARGRRAAEEQPASAAAYLKAVQPGAVEPAVIRMEALDQVWLRTNPQAAEAAAEGHGSGVLPIARLLAERGVRVVNDPSGLARAGSKVYLMRLPEEARPRTLIASDAGTLKRFLRSLAGPAVLKPAVGFGGESVFYVRRGEVANVNQYIAALRRTGPVIAQEYLEGARRGDKRVLVLGGKPLMAGGLPAAYKRTHPRDDIRNNMHVGGRRSRTSLTAEDLATLERIGPTLCADGIYLAGVDLVDAKVLEVNVWSPGGIHNISELYGIDVAGAIVDRMERDAAPRLAPVPRERAS